jgi:hypothetical protein
MKTSHRTRATLILVTVALLAPAALSSPAPSASGRTVPPENLTADDPAGMPDPVREARLLYHPAAKLTALAPAADDNFGFSVAISGDTVVVGAPEESSYPDPPDPGGGLRL